MKNKNLFLASLVFPSLLFAQEDEGTIIKGGPEDFTNTVIATDLGNGNIQIWPDVPASERNRPGFPVTLDGMIYELRTELKIDATKSFSLDEIVVSRTEELGLFGSTFDPFRVVVGNGVRQDLLRTRVDKGYTVGGIVKRLLREDETFSPLDEDRVIYFSQELYDAKSVANNFDEIDILLPNFAPSNFETIPVTQDYTPSAPFQFSNGMEVGRADRATKPAFMRFVAETRQRDVDVILDKLGIVILPKMSVGATFTGDGLQQDTFVAFKEGAANTEILNTQGLLPNMDLNVQDIYPGGRSVMFIRLGRNGQVDQDQVGMPVLGFNATGNVVGNGVSPIVFENTAGSFVTDSREINFTKESLATYIASNLPNGANIGETCYQFVIYSIPLYENTQDASLTPPHDINQIVENLHPRLGEVNAPMEAYAGPIMCVGTSVEVNAGVFSE